MTGFGASLCSLVFPFAAKYSESINYAFVARFIMGVSQGALFPAVYVFLCEWLPRDERSKWLPVPSAFSRIGTIVMNQALPIILINYGWESVFYVSGGAALVWCIVFIIFASDSPQQSRWISTAELTHIESCMDPPANPASIAPQQAKSVTASGFSINEAAEKSLSTPSVSWTKIVTNKAILMLSLVMFTSEWSNMLLLVKLPGFLGSVLKLDLVEVGLGLKHDSAKYTTVPGLTTFRSPMTSNDLCPLDRILEQRPDLHLLCPVSAIGLLRLEARVVRDRELELAESAQNLRGCR